MRNFWIGYCVILLTLGVTRGIERIVIGSGGFMSRYLPIIIAAVISFGIYHCLENRAIIHQKFWLLVYWLLIVVNLMSVGAIIIVFLYQLHSLWTDTLLLVGISFLLFPALIKIRQYATLQRIWKNAAND